MAASHYINNTWIPGDGSLWQSTNPATDALLWSGHAASRQLVDDAYQAATQAFQDWAALALDKRLAYLETFRTHLEKNQSQLAEVIALETGKPLWEAALEVKGMLGKLGLTQDGYAKRCGEFQVNVPGARGITRFQPIGPSVVFGPFNLPGHLPNGHILPLLLAGNTVIFKPSPLTPKVGEEVMKLFESAQLPPGVINLVQGGKETGRLLSEHPDCKALCFTGSYAVGKILHQTFAGHPEKMLALEMGGNNPLIVHEADNLEAAAYMTVQSAYITSGQRCVCARRLIVPTGAPGDLFLDLLIKWIHRIQVGPCNQKPEPFMGPVISKQAANRILQSTAALESLGGIPLVALQQLPLGEAFLSPGLMDVTTVQDRGDDEIFGPFLQVIRVPDFDHAIKEANRTRFGLAAGLLSDNADLYKRFQESVHAGIKNWNRQITGASGAMPFGGTGLSGNFRPSAYFAADYTAYPVAFIESETLSMPEKLTPGMG